MQQVSVISLAEGVPEYFTMLSNLEDYFVASLPIQLFILISGLRLAELLNMIRFSICIFQ